MARTAQRIIMVCRQAWTHGLFLARRTLATRSRLPFFGMHGLARGLLSFALIVWLATGCSDALPPHDRQSDKSGGRGDAGAGKPPAAEADESTDASAPGDEEDPQSEASARDARTRPGRDDGTDGESDDDRDDDAEPSSESPSDASVPSSDGPSPDAGGPPRDAGSEVDEERADAPQLPSVSSTSADGPFATTQDLSGGPRGRSGVFRPAELGRDGLKHPVFVWGCGGSSTPAQYADQLSRIASHGFVVVAEVVRIGDAGAPLSAAIDWIIAEDAREGSPFEDHIATRHIALGGHSIGSANSFYIADDPRLTTTIHVAGGSLDNVNDPFAPTTGMGGARIVHPVAYICSMSDTFRNVEKTEKDYENTRAPAFMTVMTGVDHVAAARSGLPATLAWLRWHLAGESERRADFLEEDGEFTTGIFVSRSKNW